MNILVVGGAGYIGAHVVKMLCGRGHAVTVYDNLSKGHRAAVRAVPFVKGDLGDRKKLRKLFSAQKFDAVMHFAAFIEVGESVLNPAKYYDNNFTRVLVLLEEMLSAGIKHFVFSSTAAVFGNPVAARIDENHPKNPINPYGESKLMLERALAAYETAYGLRSVIFRYFNAAGADDGGKMGESHTPETHLIPLVLQAAAGKRESIKVFGTDYPTPDGTCVRDYIHVNDLASAHILGLERMVKENASDNFNLGSGAGFSVKEIIDAAKKVTGRDFKVDYAPKRAGDPAVLIAAPQKAERVLGWARRYDLQKIIKTAWNWELKRKY